MSESHESKGIRNSEGAYHEVPIGMERLLGLAAVDDRLAEELERDPLALADGCGITLEVTERAMLAATPPAALRSMLSGIRVGLAPPDRREFMQNAAVIVAALAVGGVAAVSGCKKTTPEPSAPGPSKSPDMGTTPPDMGTTPPDMAVVSKPDAGAPAVAPPRYMDQIKRAISPRRPRPLQPATGTGVRPR